MRLLRNLVDVPGNVTNRRGEQNDASPLLSRAQIYGPALIILCAIAISLFFWNGLVSLADAWGRPEYSHGPLIPIISAFLFLRQLREEPPRTKHLPQARWPGVALIVMSLLIAAIGNLAQIPDLVTYGLILWGGGLVLTIMGWRRGRAFWPPVLHLVYMLPLPAFLYWKMSIGLQLVSSEIGVDIIRMMGIPVFLDGNIIDLGVYKLHVAEACSGLRYLFPILSFSYIFAVLYSGPIWHKAVLLLSAAPITILMNSFRIGVIGVLVDNYGIEQAEGFLHVFEGWVIFGACVALLIGLAYLMQRLQRAPAPLSEVLDLNVDRLGAEAARIRDVRATPALITATLVTLLAALMWILASNRVMPAVERDPLYFFPRDIGAWRSGPPKTLSPGVLAVLGADDYRSVDFSAPRAEAPIDLFIAYYDELTNGSGIHSPEVCIPVGGWEMSSIEQSRISLPGARGSVQVNRAIIQKRLSQRLVYYWFEQRGRSLTNDYVAKAYTVVDAITIGRTDGALVRVITPIVDGNIAQADKRLQAFVADAKLKLPRFIPN